MMATAGGIWHRVAETGDVPEGVVRLVDAGGCPIALSCVGGAYGALANACPHKGGSLGEGAIENGLLVCPWHGHEFDPRTGESSSFALPAAAYPVEVREDGIYVRVTAAPARS